MFNGINEIVYRLTVIFTLFKYRPLFESNNDFVNANKYLFYFNTNVIRIKIQISLISINFFFWYSAYEEQTGVLSRYKV